jgi:hypothetical protein
VIMSKITGGCIDRKKFMWCSPFTPRSLWAATPDFPGKIDLTD